MIRYLKHAFVAGLMFLAMAAAGGPLGSVGTYNGTLSFKYYNVVTGEKSAGKESVVLTINSNNTYTMAVNNLYLFSGTAVLGETVAAFHFADSVEEMHTSVHFKGTTAKGTFLNTTMVGDKFVWEGKLSFKKQ